MLDARLYRAALVPVILAIVVAAFSLQNRPVVLGTTNVPDAFDSARASATLDDLVSRFPDRRPGSTGDNGLAAYVADALGRRAEGNQDPFQVTSRRFDAQTIDGRQTLTNVVATRAGAPGPGLLIVAHRDAADSGSRAQLSATAVLLELGRVFADGRLSRTTTLVSTSGGSGGNAGAAQAVKELPGPIGAVLVIGDMAGATVRTPMVVATSGTRGQAPLQLQRTVSAAVRAEAGMDAGILGPGQQFVRMALPFSPGEQGTLLRDGLPAVTLQVSGEQGPAGEDALAPGRLALFGRVALRAINALDEAPRLQTAAADDIVSGDKVLPGWAVRVLVASLLLAPLLVAIDACARVRRRGERVLVWAVWTLATALPFALAAAVIVLMGTTGVLAIHPPAPVLPDVVPVAAAPIALTLLVFLLGWGVRHLVGRSLMVGASSLREEEGAGPALLLVVAVAAWVAWIVNPFAAALLVLPAHLWIPIVAPAVRVRRGLGVFLVFVSLLPVAAVLVSLADQLGYGGGGLPAFAWALLLGVAAGQPGAAAWLLWSVVFGAAVSVVIVAVRGQPDPQARPDVTVRGPVSYAGPGSLGGTSSGFRRG